MTEHCGIGAWAQNSTSSVRRRPTQAAHSCASRSCGTYFPRAHDGARAVERVCHVFHVEPRREAARPVRLLPPGASHFDGSTGPHDCPRESRPRVRSGDTDPTYMSFASPRGPWSEPARLFPRWTGSDDFAPLILPSGSVLRCGARSARGRVFLATSPDWRNASTRAAPHRGHSTTSAPPAPKTLPLPRHRRLVPRGVPPHVRRRDRDAMVARHVRRARLLARRTDGSTGVAWGNAEHPHGNAVPFIDGSNFSCATRVFDASGEPAP